MIYALRLMSNRLLFVDADRSAEATRLAEARGGYKVEQGFEAMGNMLVVDVAWGGLDGEIPVVTESR